MPGIVARSKGVAAAAGTAAGHAAAVPTWPALSAAARAALLSAARGTTIVAHGTCARWAEPAAAVAAKKGHALMVAARAAVHLAASIAARAGSVHFAASAALAHAAAAAAPAAPDAMA